MLPQTRAAVGPLLIFGYIARYIGREFAKGAMEQAKQDVPDLLDRAIHDNLEEAIERVRLEFRVMLHEASVRMETKGIIAKQVSKAFEDGESNELLNNFKDKRKCV
jgi:hypothetical protein